MIRGVYKHNGNAYIPIIQVAVTKFIHKDGEEPDMEYVKAYRDWVGADHVLRTQTHFMFCETIQDVDWEDIPTSEVPDKQDQS